MDGVKHIKLEEEGGEPEGGCSKLGVEVRRMCSEGTEGEGKGESAEDLDLRSGNKQREKGRERREGERERKGRERKREGERGGVREREEERE